MDCTTGEVPSVVALSSCTGDFGDERSPKPLVKCAKVDLPKLADCLSSCDSGCGILRLLAHEDIPEGDNIDGASHTGLLSLEAVESRTLEAVAGGEDKSVWSHAATLIPNTSTPVCSYQYQPFSMCYKVDLYVGCCLQKEFCYIEQSLEA